mmetsp:Transcript_43306/g.122426  ORF Transcript_43306/g.122426 Transcript_43306/m.122426 type:complete len:366 (-) Transcript_43306:102-1199(-)
MAPGGWFKSASGPTEEEKRALVEQLQGRFADADLDEVTIGRFLLTRSWDLDGTTKMLQAHVNWRRENLPVSLEEVQPILDEGKFALLGTGAERRPAFAIRFGPMLKVDFKQKGEMERHIRAAVYCAEAMIASMAPGVETWTAVIDCTGIRAPPQAYMQEFTKVMQANYPERAYKIVMYPIPRFIVTVVKTFMVMLPEKTREKAAGASADGAVVARERARDASTVSFVSSIADLCEETGVTQSALPESMLGQTDLEVLKGASVLELGAGKSSVHRHTVAAGDTVKWSFRVLEHNVGFELRFAAEESSSPASPSSGAGAGYSLRKTDKVAEDMGEFTAEQAGALEFMFDNTFSYMRGKTIVVSCLSS